MNLIYLGIYFVLGIGVLHFENRVYRKCISPLMYFSFVWCVVGFGANLALYNYYFPSNKVNNLIILMIIFFSAIWILVENYKGIITYDYEKKPCTIDVGYIGIFVVELIILIFIYPRLSESIHLLISGGVSNMAALRGSVFDAELDTGNTSELIDLLVKPAISTVSLIAAVSLFNRINTKKLIFIWCCNIFNILIFVIATAGRMTIVNMFFFMVISIIVFSGHTILSYLKRNKKLVIVFASIITAVLIMQNQRQSDTSVLKTIYMYYFSGPAYLSQILERNNKLFYINREFMLGSATFGFITNYFSYALILFTHKPQGSLYMLGSVLTNSSYPVGDDMKLNAMCTCLYNFLLDWGYLGVILGPISTVVITQIVYTKAAKENNILSKCLLVFTINVLIRSIFKWDLLSFDFSMIYFYIMFIRWSNNIVIYQRKF